AQRSPQERGEGRLKPDRVHSAQSAQRARSRPCQRGSYPFCPHLLPRFPDLFVLDLHITMRDGSITAWTTLAESVSSTRLLSYCLLSKPARRPWPAWSSRPDLPGPPHIGWQLRSNIIDLLLAICRDASSSDRGSASCPLPRARTGSWPPPDRFSPACGRSGADG